MFDGIAADFSMSHIKLTKYHQQNNLLQFSSMFTSFSFFLATYVNVFGFYNGARALYVCAENH
jgi:hypothetical protein